jgi:transcriptional regulator with XRE-family HTH domain
MLLFSSNYQSKGFNSQEETVSFGEKIKKLRLEKGWSQDLLGEKVGVHGRHVGKYEKDKVMPNAETAVQLARAFEVSTDYLLMDEEEDKVSFKEINDTELKHSFESIDQMDSSDKETVKIFLDAFIKKKKFEDLMNNKLA